mmetsp:Transcript_17795/g.30520  ORF Transcript_17795/g.30520 Transcript_17795/m.30520 type:complete len:221 (-) Transcript_17795:739-1401(-)
MSCTGKGNKTSRGRANMAIPCLFKLSSVGSVISSPLGSIGPLCSTSTKMTWKNAKVLPKDATAMASTVQMLRNPPVLLPHSAVAIRPPSVSPVGMQLSALISSPAQPASISEFTCTIGSARCPPRKIWASPATNKESAKEGDSTPMSVRPTALRAKPNSNRPDENPAPYRGPREAKSKRAVRFGRKVFNRVMPPKLGMNPNPAGMIKGRYISAPCFLAAW